MKEKEDKKKRKKRDVDAPKKPMCAFFWYQRDAKNFINDPELQHKDKIKVSDIFLRKSGDDFHPFDYFHGQLKSDKISKVGANLTLNLPNGSEIASIFPIFDSLIVSLGSSGET